MKFIPIIISIAIAQLAGIIGSVFTASNVQGWYPALVKPELNPPSWVFAPVWTTLYVLMGISAYLVWKKKDVEGRTLALFVYGAQLALNALWSIVFFGMQSPGAGLVVIGVLLVSILITMKLFCKIDRLATTLLIPYVLWVSFATYLNYSIYALN